MVATSKSGEFLIETKEVIKTNKLIIVLMVCYVFSSSLSKIGVFDLTNKGIVGFLCLVIIGLFCRKKQTHFTFLVLSLTALVHVIAFAFPVSPKEGIATYFMFAFWVLFWLYVGDNKKDFLAASKSLKTVLKMVLILWTTVTAISFFIPICYKLGWGGERYFTSFTMDSFEIAPIALFMLALDILLFCFDKDKRSAILFAIVPLACVFAAGTRTYLIVVLVEFVVLLRLAIERNSRFYATSLICLIGFILLASVTNIGQKFLSATVESNDINVILEVFTNGRSEFWTIDFNAFLDGSAFEVLFGHGFSYVYELNQATIGMRLYAHNDFINILLNFGIVGMGLYFAVFIPVLVKTKRESGSLVAFLLSAIWLFNAFFNMIYVYIAAVMALGILATALSYQASSVSADGGAPRWSETEV